MKKIATAYLMFAGFTLFTSLVIRPIAIKANVPLLKDI